MSLATGHERTPLGKHSLVQNWNDRLPLEILEQIFIRVVDSNIKINLPPKLTEQPWVLGRVCSSWRRTSRSIPKFWKTDIEFNQNRSHHLKKLECAVEILPTNITTMSLSVYVADVFAPVVPARNLIPFLPYITHLSWCCTSYNPSQDFLGLLSPGSFSRVKTLTITLVWPAVLISLAGIFGETSRLESLKLLSDSPAVLLLSDIPWHQLSFFKISFEATDPIRHGWHRLSLITGATDMSRDVTRPLWMKLAMDDPFYRMTSLTTLHLDLTGEYMDLMLSCSFPWDRLKAFALYYDRPVLLTRCMKIVEKCISLLSLDFQGHFAAVWEPRLFPDIYNVRVPPFEHLRVGYKTPSEVIKTLCSPTLLCLNMCTGRHGCPALPGILLEDFYRIIEQCPCLETIACYLRRRNESSIPSRTVIAPRLTSLTVHFSKDAEGFPTMMQAPVLKELVLEGDLPDPLIDYVPDFILDSNQYLERFSMAGHRHHPSLKQFRKLSSALNSCTNVDLSKPVYPLQEVMEAIDAIDLFPCAEKLWLGSLYTIPPELLVTWIEARFEQEATQGMVILRQFIICYYYEPEDSDEWLYGTSIEIKFRELETRYGVVCQVDWVCVQ